MRIIDWSSDVCYSDLDCSRLWLGARKSALRTLLEYNYIFVVIQGVSLTGADHSIRSNVSVNVDRGTLNVRETDALLAPLDRAATINCIFSAALVGGRPPCRPRRFAAARPAMIRARVNAFQSWASPQQR